MVLKKVRSAKIRASCGKLTSVQPIFTITFKLLMQYLTKVSGHFARGFHRQHLELSDDDVFPAHGEMRQTYVRINFQILWVNAER